jgi:hypothetical protein
VVLYRIGRRVRFHRLLAKKFRARSTRWGRFQSRISFGVQADPVSRDGDDVPLLFQIQE